MKSTIAISGAALLALTAFVNTADARMMGGSSASSSRTFSSNMPVNGGHSGSTRTFSPDGKTFSPDGLQARIKDPDSRHTKWKQPIDSDGGGPADPPPKKTPSGGTTGSGSGNGGGVYDSGPKVYGNWDRYGYHPHRDWQPDPPLACKGRPC